MLITLYGIVVRAALQFMRHGSDIPTIIPTGLSLEAVAAGARSRRTPTCWLSLSRP